MKLAVFILGCFMGALAYIPSGKEALLSDVFLREVVSRMGKDLTDAAYLDFPDSRLPLGVRSLGKDLEEEQLFPVDYDTLGESNLHPSLRDQEFLQHSSLWGSQFMSGGAGEGKQRLKPEGSMKNRQEVKTDATLPAYCNPPNPCPLGYTGEQGCLSEFENTASFSRRYQAAQDCMCDSEHMFDCPNPAEPPQEDPMDALNELEFNRFLQHTIKNRDENPFLVGERLPIAAKKGHHVIF